MKSSSQRTAPNHQVRIIGGRYKRTPLPVIDTPGLRPTPDRVRETLFNWLGHLWQNEFTDLHALDLFAGTGALGMEAASRGFGRVTLIENDSRAAAALEKTRTRLAANHVRLLRTDAYRFVASNRDKYDLILLDPPFGSDRLNELLHQTPNHLKPDGLIYVETGAPLNVPDALQLVREGHAGAVYFYLLEPNHEKSAL